MRNPFRDALRRAFSRNQVTETPKKLLDGDGVSVVQFPASWSSTLRAWGVGNNYAQIFASQYNVRTAIDTIAREAATLHMQVFESDPRGPLLPNSEIPLIDHPLQYLLSSSAPGMSSYRFWYSLFSDMMVYDLAFWQKIRQDGAVKALVRIPPADLTPVRHPITNKITGWRTTNNKVISPRNLVTFWGYDPSTNEGSISPMETMRRLLSEEYYAGLDREGRWRNAARKDGVIERHVDSPMMDDVGKEGFLLDMEDALAGPAGSGRALVLQPGMQYKDVQWSPRELEYIQSRRLSRTEVAGFFHMPAAMMVAAENGKDPDKETLDFFYTSTLPPWLVRVEHEIQAQLVPEFEFTEKRQRAVHCEFNLDEKLRGSFEQRIGILATAAGGPIVTVNEARARENLPPIEGGDMIFVPLNSIRAGGPQGSSQAPIATPATGIEPAGTTPGGGSQVQQASVADVQAGNAVVLGPESAKKAIYGIGGSIEELLGNIEAAETERVREFEKAEDERVIRSVEDAFLIEQRARYEERTQHVIEKTFERQRGFADRGLKIERWNKELGEDLYGVLLQMTSIVGDKLAAIEGTSWYAHRHAETLKQTATNLAMAINEETQEKITDEDTFSSERAIAKAEDVVSWGLGWVPDVLGKQHELASLTLRST